MSTTSQPRPSTHRRGAWLARSLAAVVLVLLAPACATTGDGGLAADSATELAAGADELADLLDAEQSCEAIDRAEALRVQARDGRAAGEVPDDVLAQVEQVTTRVTGDLACEPEAPDEPVDAGGGDPEEGNESNGNESNGNEGNGNGNEGKGQDKGKDKGKGKEGKGRSGSDDRPGKGNG